jgi:hypothetical protein
MAIPPPEVERILSQVRSELLKMIDANEIGQLTVHCGTSNIVVEVNRKLEPVGRIKKVAEPTRSR